MKLRSEKGFTVAEAVVAIALIIMGMVSAITISYYSASRTETAYMQFRAYNAAYDVINCYREACKDYPEDESQQGSRFVAYLRFYNSYTDMEMSEADGYSVYEFGMGNIKVRTSVKYESADIFVACYGGESGNEIYSVGYNVKTNMEIGL